MNKQNDEVSPTGYMQYANQALSLIERNEMVEFSPSKYPPKCQTQNKNVQRNTAPGTTVMKNGKGILLEKKGRISRATTT
jgi:hypothetical protein